MPSRTRVEPSDDWRQLALLVREPAQRAYELIRPAVLFGQSPAERARQTGAAERTIYRHAARFDQQGLAGLLPAPATPQPRRLPPEIRRTILELKAEHPPLRPHEIATIVDVRLGYPVSHHTVKRIVTTEAISARARRYPPLSPDRRSGRAPAGRHPPAQRGLDRHGDPADAACEVLPKSMRERALDAVRVGDAHSARAVLAEMVQAERDSDLSRGLGDEHVAVASTASLTTGISVAGDGRLPDKSPQRAASA
jgi:transposase